MPGSVKCLPNYVNFEKLEGKQGTASTPPPQHKHKHFLCGDPPLKHLGELGVIQDTGGGELGQLEHKNTITALDVLSYVQS